MLKCWLDCSVKKTLVCLGPVTSGDDKSDQTKIILSFNLVGHPVHLIKELKWLK